MTKQERHIQARAILDNWIAKGTPCPKEIQAVGCATCGASLAGRPFRRGEGDTTHCPDSCFGPNEKAIKAWWKKQPDSARDKARREMDWDSDLSVAAQAYAKAHQC